MFDSTYYKNSSLLHCPKCKRSSVNVDSRDNFQLRELAERFKDHDMPCKFIRFELNDKDFIIEMN